MTGLLSIENLSKSYGRVRALKNVSCTLDTGVHALLGPNGSGKSTLMHLLTQNLRADSGHIFFEGEDISSMGKRYRERIGFMPQNAGIPAGFTLGEFLMYMACLKGLEKKEAERQSAHLLEAVELSDCKNRRADTFSGGMRQRALLAQAMLGEPSLLILDEPTAGLDPMQRLRVKNLLSHYGKEHCVLLATHIVTDLRELSPHLMFLKKGELSAAGTLPALQKRLSGLFWEIPPHEVAPSHRVIKNSMGHLRVFCETKPCDSALSVVPDIEDCYYYHFGESGV